MFSSFGTYARLSVVVAVSVFVGLVLGDQWSWHRHWLNQPWQSLGWLALVVASVIIVVGLMVKHSWASAPVSAVLGGAAVAWGFHILKDISWSSLGILALIVVGFAVLVGLSFLLIHRPVSYGHIRSRFARPAAVPAGPVGGPATTPTI
jgi:hypothetical protein